MPWFYSFLKLINTPLGISDLKKKKWFIYLLLCSICLFVWVFCCCFVLFGCMHVRAPTYSWLPRSSGKGIRPPGAGVTDGCELRTEPQLSVRVECACKCWASPKAVSNLSVVWKQWTSVSHRTVICMTYPIRGGLSKAQKQMPSSCQLLPVRQTRSLHSSTVEK